MILVAPISEKKSISPNDFLLFQVERIPGTSSTLSRTQVLYCNIDHDLLYVNYPRMLKYMT